MIDRNKRCQTYDAIGTLQLYIELAMGYIDHHEDIDKLEPIVLVFEEMRKKTKIIEDFFNEYEKLQNQLET